VHELSQTSSTEHATLAACREAVQDVVVYAVHVCALRISGTWEEKGACRMSSQEELPGLLLLGFVFFVLMLLCIAAQR
jgi:hypothetical protein